MGRRPSILTLLMGQELLYSLLMISLIVTAISLKAVTHRAPEAAAEAERAPEVRAAQEREIDRLRVQISAMEQELARANDDRVRLAQISRRMAGGGIAGPSDQPPIIFLSEADGYSFASGSAEISPGFARKIRDEVVPRLLELTSVYRADVIEVIGHTDGVPLRGARFEANLDAELARSVLGGSAARLVPFDNVGLGMTRAIAVALLLEQAPELRRHVTVLPLSAGALIARGDRLDPASSEASVAERRRIEIRIRRSKI